MPLNQPLLAEMKFEATKTRKCLERLSEENFSWKPHEKSMSLLQLATHIAAIFNWVPRIANAAEFDGNSATISRPEPPATVADLVKDFDQKLEAAVTALATITDEAFHETWVFTRNGQVVFSLPRIAAIRNIVFNHSVHHRGQLTVYMRELNIPVPSIYGPSADEAF